MDAAEAFTPAGGPRARFGALLWRVGAIGADPADSRELRDKKTLLVLTTLAVQPAGLMWGGLYWAYGEHLAALIPWSYTPASLLALLVFARTRSFSFMRAAQLTIILVLPALLMLALGGITPSSGVILWSLLAPVGAVVYDSPRRAWAWFAAFIALLAATVALAPLLRTSPERAARRADQGVRRPQHRGAVARRVRAPDGVRDPAGAGAGPGRVAAAQRPPARDRRAPSGDAARDRRPLRRREHPLRGRRRLHTAERANDADRARRDPRSPLLGVRRPGRQVRGREDQDDRRLLHGRRGRPDAARRPRARARASWRSRCGSARRTACPSAPTSSSASASAPGPSSPA